MMTTPGGETAAEIPDGQRWLRLIGYADLIGLQVELVDGRTLVAEDFPDASERCRVMAGDLFRGIERAPLDDPDREADIALGRDIFESHFLRGAIIKAIPAVGRAKPATANQ